MSRAYQVEEYEPHVRVKLEAAMNGLKLPAPAISEKDARINEKKEQAAIVKLFKKFGCKVYNLSQPRATKQSPGLPDLFVFHASSCKGWWWESKRQVGGALSEFQEEFRTLSVQCGVLHGVGDRYDAEKFIAKHGIKGTIAK